MYRQYEDPYVLEQRVKELQAEYDACEDLEEAMSIAESLYEMEARARFAWEDDEFDMDYE